LSPRFSDYSAYDLGNLSPKVHLIGFPGIYPRKHNNLSVDITNKLQPVQPTSFSKSLIPSGTDTMIITRGFSLTNFVIASSAFCFQVFVLYPWHHQLDDEFKQLKTEHLRLLQEGEKNRLEELRSIREQLGLLSTKKD
jgi:hypothetical protein